MESVESIKQQWLREANELGVAYEPRSDRLLWSWPINVRVSDAMESNISQAIWEHGIIFTYSLELPVDTLVMIQRINGRFEEPWVYLRTMSSKQGDKGKYIIKGEFV